ncbi:hypothetical protein J4479_01335 [Candidatus Woesearchaeota archaeon]|nr:hypothetical protein [Candidatus Woesearchaeota archaeon]
MSLRELKKEIESLPSLGKTVADFKKHWLKPIRANTNQHLPFLQQLTAEQKEQLNTLILKAKGVMGNLEEAQLLQNKLRSYIHYLIELKLTALNNNKSKAQLITNHLLNDEFLNLKNTIADIKSFEENVKTLEAHHHEVTEYLEKQITLEQALIFMELPHWRYLQNLLQVTQDHKRIVRDLGRHFVSLAKTSNQNED